MILRIAHAAAIIAAVLIVTLLDDMPPDRPDHSAAVEAAFRR